MLQIQNALTHDPHRPGLPASQRLWRVFSLWITGLAMALLAACGGGGGGDAGPSPGPGTSPAMPAGVTATAGHGETTITWGAVAGATSYNIYRSNTQGVQGTKVGASSTTSYVDATTVNGTTYYYQVTADNAAGEGPASTQSPGVTPTPPVTAPPAPSGISASPGNAQVTVSWTAVTGASSYNVYRSTSAGSPGSKIGSSMTPVYTDTTAANGSTYFYVVTAENAAGEGPTSAQSSGAAPAVPVTVPAAPTGVSASAGNAQVTVSWTAVTGATSYNIYRSTSQGSQGPKVGASSTTAYLDATAVNGTTYYYVVAADNAAGEGLASTQSAGATPAVPPVPPAAPTGVNVVAGNAQVTVTWTAVTGATSYNIYRSSSQGSLGTKIGSSASANLTDSSAVNGMTYYYEITAVNAAGESPASTQSAAATPAVPVTLPAAPTGVNVTAGNAQVTVTWMAASGAASYNIYRSTSPGSQGTKIGSSSTLTLTDSSVANGSTYYYLLRAVNAAGEGPASTQSAAATPAVPVTLPPAPTGVNVAAGNAQVSVSWTAAPGATSYNIYRSTTPGSQGAKIGSSANATLTDSSALNGTSYYYVVTAVNAAGEGPASTQSAAATPTVPVTLPAAPTGVNVAAGNAQVTVTWTATTGATSYNIYRSSMLNSIGTKIGSSSNATFTDSSALNGTTYYYVVRAVNSAGEGPASTQSAAATPAAPVTLPAAPTGVVATAGNAQVSVSWTAATGATSYNIYRSTTPGSQGSKIGSSVAVNYTDGTAVNGTTYYYSITAVNTAGEGPASTQSAAATPAAPITVPAAPTGVNATAGHAQATVTWTAATGSTSYNIYRSTSQGSQGAKIGASASTSYTDATVVNGTTYYYVITAVNTAGEGAASAQSSGVTPTPAASAWANVKFGGGGYVPGLIFHPTVANVLYARTDVAGAYRWDNVHSKWIPITDMFGFNEGQFQGVESIAVDPTDANKVYLVGGMYVNGGNARLYKSSDQGANWTYVDLPFPTGGNNAGRAIGERLMVDPNKPSVLFYATRTQGLWKSTDSGTTWNQVTGLSTYKMTTGGSNPDIAQFGNSPIGMEGVVFDTAVPTSGFVSSGTATQTLYVPVAPDYKELAGLSYYMYKSNDGGTTWTGIAIPSLVTTFTNTWQPTPIKPYIPHMVRDTDTTGNRKFYVVFSGDTGPGAGGPAWLYSFDGTNWSAPLKSTQRSQWTSPGFGGVSVSGTGASTRIALGGTNLWGGWSGMSVVMLSKDAGQTWTEIADNRTASGWMDDVEINPFNPENVLHVHGGGVWSTSNASAATPSWTEIVDGIEELATRSLTTPPPGASYLFVAGYWDVGTQIHTNVNTKPTTNVPGSISFGNGNGGDMAWTNPAYIAAIGSTNGNSGNNSVVGVYSTDSGVTWTAFPSQPPFAPAGANVDHGGSGEANIAVTAQGKMVWAPSTKEGNAVSDGVPHYTTNNGATWTATNLPRPVQTSINSAYHLAADRKNPNKVYAYDGGGARWSNTIGKFYYSTDGGKTFTMSTDPVLNGLSFQQWGLTWLAVNPYVEGDVWLTNGHNVFHSTDSGVSWTKLTTMGSVPANYDQYQGPTYLGAQRIALGKPLAGSSYSAAVYLVGTVGGVAGLFRSDNGGASWTRINDGAHQWGGIGALAADNNVAGRVYLAGRGVLYND